MSDVDLTTSLSCNRCGQTKPLAEFARNSRRSRGYRYACKACLTSQRRAHRLEDNPPGPLLPGTITPDTRIIGADGRDWTWAFVLFRDIPGFPGYQINTDGAVWSRLCRNGSDLVSAWRPMKHGRHPYGYPRVHLSRDGKKHEFFVHQLVLMTFIGPCPPGMECCHNNGKPADCRSVNLRWDTKASNAQDAFRHGSRGVGSRHPNSKLTEEKVIGIRRRYLEGYTQTRIGDEFGVTQSAVWCVIRGKVWKHVPWDTD